MPFAVFLAGHTTPKLEAEHGDYGDMAINILRGDDSETWVKFPVCDGIFPEELHSFEVSIRTLSNSPHPKRNPSAC